MYKVSIIVPVYNAENYLKECIESILTQTYKNFELILINDGSKDDSYKIMNKYKKDNRIKIYNQENKGAAATRNLGIKESTGDYIVFIDSDDFVTNNYIEKLINNIDNNDCIVSGYNKYLNNKKISTIKPRKKYWSIYKFNATCGKLYKLDFIKKNNILFSSKYKIGEDIYFTVSVISHTKDIKIIDYAGYNININENSVTNKANKSKETRNDKMLSLLKDIEKKVSKSKHINKNMQLFFYLKTIIFHLITQRYILTNKEYYNEYQLYFNWYEKIATNYNINSKKLYWQKGEEFKINLICNCFNISRKLKMEKMLLFLLQKIKIGGLV